MKKQLLRTSSTKDLFMVYDDITSRNVLYSSEHLTDCINYFENGGAK